MSTKQHDDVLDTQRPTPGDQSPGYQATCGHRPAVATTPHEWGWQSQRL